MIKETFAPFQPGLWQEEGLVTVVAGGEDKPATIFRKMEKWIAAATAAVAVSVALAGAFPAHTSFVTDHAGAASRFVLGMDSGAATSTIENAEVPANYWSDLAREVATWPRLSLNRSSDDDPEPIA